MRLLPSSCSIGRDSRGKNTTENKNPACPRGRGLKSMRSTLGRVTDTEPVMSNIRRHTEFNSGNACAASGNFILSKFRRPRAINSEPSRDSVRTTPGCNAIIQHATAPRSTSTASCGASERFDRNSEPRQTQARTQPLSVDLGGLRHTALTKAPPSNRGFLHGQRRLIAPGATND